MTGHRHEYVDGRCTRCFDPAAPHPSDSERTPRTKAGRDLLAYVTENDLRDGYNIDLIEEAILAIEHEAESTGTPEAGGVNLTAREAEIVELRIEGLTNKEVAHRLGLAESTVKNHMVEAFARNNVLNIVVLAVQYDRTRR